MEHDGDDDDDDADDQNEDEVTALETSMPDTGNGLLNKTTGCLCRARALPPRQMPKNGAARRNIMPLQTRGGTAVPFAWAHSPSIHVGGWYQQTQAHTELQVNTIRILGKILKKRKRQPKYPGYPDNDASKPELHASPAV